MFFCVILAKKRKTIKKEKGHFEIFSISFWLHRHQLRENYGFLFKLFIMPKNWIRREYLEKKNMNGAHSHFKSFIYRFMNSINESESYFQIRPVRSNQLNDWRDIQCIEHNKNLDLKIFLLFFIWFFMKWIKQNEKSGCVLIESARL